MNTFTTGNEIVDEMATIQITGNVIPQIWYRKILKETGKPDLLAITLLSDIVYWYRPVEERDEATGQLIGYRKRFKDDLLQRSYDSFAEQFGENKRAVRDAIARLEALGVIRRDLRTVVTASGVRCNNVLYIELIPDKLYELTHERARTEPMTENCHRCDEKGHTLIQKNVIGYTKNCNRSIQKNVIGHTKICKTNTEITTENNTEIISSSPKSPYGASENKKDDDLKHRIDLDNAIKKYPKTAAIVYDEIRRDVKNNALYDSLLYAWSFMDLCENIEKHSSPIGNLGAYIRTCLKNMVPMQGIRQEKKSDGYMQNSYDFDSLEKQILSN